MKNCDREATHPSKEQRLFVGIEVPETVKDKVAHAQALLKDKIIGVRWVDPANIHVTLKFLGNCRTDKISDICSAIQSGLAGQQAFNCVTGAFGAFPSSRKARVLWLGLNSCEPLEGLFRLIDSALSAPGFEAETRYFKPHITVARLKKPGPIDFAEAAFLEKEKLKVVIDSVILFASHLSPVGATYEILKRFEFQ